MADERFDIGLSVSADWRAMEDFGVAKLAPNVIAWNKSSSTDVVGYRVRLSASVVDYTDPPIDVGDVAHLDFAQVPSMAGVDGVFNVGVTAVDDGGNESDFARLDAFPLDLVPPDAPTNLRRL